MFAGIKGMPPGFDPSKLDPQLISEMSELMMTLPPDKMMKLQGLIHNSMAGIDVTKDMGEFESSLPPGFREKMARILYRMHGVDVGTAKTESVGVVEPEVLPSEHPSTHSTPPRDIHDARKVILRGVASGSGSPEDALQLLFPEG